MKSHIRKFAIPAIVVIAGFGIFVGLAQTQMIFVPYFTPTIIEIKGLEERYLTNGTAEYTVNVKGYGSNCLILKVVTTYLDGESTSENNDITFYRKADDCRYMTIQHAPYNVTKSFVHTGNILSKPGAYQVEVEFMDQIAGQTTTRRTSFVVS